MQIIPLEPRDIIASSGDPDPEAEIESMSWREYWNILLPLFMSLLLGFSSCHDGDLPNPPERELVPASFSVEIEGDAETRLSFDGTGDSKMVFVEGDQIKLHDGCETPHLLTYNAEEKRFKGSVCANSSYTDYRAVYPASTTSAYNEVSISATQTAVNGSFDKASVPMIANAPERTKLSFKLAFSLLNIQVPAGYSKIVISNYSSTNVDYDLTGTATLTYDTDVHVTKNSGERKSSVSLVPGSGQSTIPAGTYYMSVFPCTLSGLQMACYQDDKISFRCKAEGGSIVRAYGLRLGNLAASDWTFTCEAVNIGCIFEEGGTNVNYYIADRNLGITAEKPDGTMYSQGGAVPSEIWGPGWILPTDNILSYWAGTLKNKNEKNVRSSFGDAKYSLANELNPIWVSLPAPEFGDNNIGNYWGTGSHYLYIYKPSGDPLSVTIKDNSSTPISSGAYIRPVFTAPAP